MYCRANTWKGMNLMASLVAPVGSTTEFDKLSMVASTVALS